MINPDDSLKTPEGVGECHLRGGTVTHSCWLRGSIQLQLSPDHHIGIHQSARNHRSILLTNCQNLSTSIVNTCLHTKNDNQNNICAVPAIPEQVPSPDNNRKKASPEQYTHSTRSQPRRNSTISKLTPAQPPALLPLTSSNPQATPRDPRPQPQPREPAPPAQAGHHPHRPPHPPPPPQHSQSPAPAHHPPRS